MGKVIEYHQLILEIKYCKLCDKTLEGCLIPCPVHRDMIADLALFQTRNILNKLG